MTALAYKKIQSIPRLSNEVEVGNSFFAFTAWVPQALVMLSYALVFIHYCTNFHRNCNIKISNFAFYISVRDIKSFLIIHMYIPAVSLRNYGKHKTPSIYKITHKINTVVRKSKWVFTSRQMKTILVDEGCHGEKIFL